MRQRNKTEMTHTFKTKVIHAGSDINTKIKCNGIGEKVQSAQNIFCCKKKTHFLK